MSLSKLASMNKTAEAILENIPHDASTHHPNVPVMGNTYHCEYSAGHEHYFQKWNEMIGFPISKPLGDKPNPMAPFQLEYHDLVHQYYWVLFNKSRKLGATSTKIRSDALDIFGKYAGHDVAMMGGNNETVSKEMLLRLDELFEDGFTDLDGVRWRHDDLIVKMVSNPGMIEFYNGTRMMGFAASKSGKSNSIRGADDIISIFLTEAAHTGVNDDKPLHNALSPNLAQYPTGHLVYESTPNGKRGMFYDFARQAKKGKGPFKYFQVGYEEGLKYNILSEDFIRKQKEDPNVDFDQEYRCFFTTSLKSAFEELNESNFLPEGQNALDLSTLLQ